MITERLLTFNSKVDPMEALSDQEITHLKNLISTLKDVAHYSNTQIPMEQHQVILKAALQWPLTERFPALDILRFVSSGFLLLMTISRLVLLHPEGSRYHSQSGVFERVVKNLYGGRLYLSACE